MRKKGIIVSYNAGNMSRKLRKKIERVIKQQSECKK